MNGLLRNFQNFISGLQARTPHIQLRVERNTLVVLGLIAVLVLGNVWLAINVIAPALGSRDELATALQEQRQTLLDARQLSQQSPEELQQQIAFSKATVTASQALFLTNGQVTEVVNALTQNANMSGIALTNLALEKDMGPTPSAPVTVTATLAPTKVPPKPAATVMPLTPGVAPTATVGIKPTVKPTARATVIMIPTNIPTPSLYQVTMIHLQAQGSSQRLLNFLARLREAELTGVVTTNLVMKGQGDLATLTLDLSLYVSSSAPVSPESSQQVRIVETRVPPSPTLVPAGPTPTPDRFYLYIVRDGDTLYTIADQFHVSAQEIVNTNGMTNLQLTKGQHLLVPVR